MRYERLILTSGDHAVTVRFHPRFTVISGVGPVEREGITSELLGALRGPRPGTNLEVVTDAGQHVAVLRPAWGLGDRALDTRTGEELTEGLTGPDGRLDLLAPHGLTLGEARRYTRFGALDLMARGAQDGLVASLATRPQGELWRVAGRLSAARQRLELASADVGATPEDTSVIAEVDARHAEFEAAQQRCDTIRHHGVFTGMACAIGGIPAVIMNRWSALGFAGVAAAFLVLGVVFRRRMDRAREAEEGALVAAGAESYGGFLHQRVAAMLGVQEAQRREISAAVTEHRKAQAQWTSLVGDVDLDWALDHKAAIAASAASGGDQEGAALARAMAQDSPSDADELTDLLAARLDILRQVGMLGESLPLILDEPFEVVDPRAKLRLMEFLVRAAGRPQIVLLTDDPGIEAWARSEALAGDLAVVSPAPEGVERGVPVAI